MAAEQNINFEALESKIQKLIHLHRSLSEKCDQLAAENLTLKAELELAEGKTKSLDQALERLRHLEQQKETNKESIQRIKRQINEIITEVDKNVALVAQNKK